MLANGELRLMMEPWEAAELDGAFTRFMEEVTAPAGDVDAE
jgi:hypothetical protein